MSSKRYKLAFGPIKDSDQPAHLCSLVRVFDRRSMGNQGRGGSRIYGKGVRMFKGMGGLHCWFYLIFLKYPMKNEILRPNYLIFIGNFKTGVTRRVQVTPPPSGSATARVQRLNLHCCMHMPTCVPKLCCLPAQISLSVSAIDFIHYHKVHVCTAPCIK